MLFAGLGANPFSAIAAGVKAGVRTTAAVVRDQRVQNVATVAAQQYAPQQYAQAGRIAAQVSRTLRPPQPPRMPPQQMQQMQPMQPMEDDGGGGAPVNKNSNILTIAAIAGVGVILLLMMRK